MDYNAPAIPCGLIAKSFFNDTFALWQCKDFDKCDFVEGENRIEISNKSIAWPSDLEHKFSNMNMDKVDKSYYKETL